MNVKNTRTKTSVLSTRLAIRSGLLLLVTMVCTLLLEMHLTGQERAEESRNDLVRRLNSIEPNIIQALWRVDPDTIRVAVDSIGDGLGVVSVSVHAQFRVNDINENFAIANAENYPCTHEFIRDYSNHIVEGLKIGSGILKVCYSEALLPSGFLMNRLSENLIRTFSVTAIMAGMLFWLIGCSVIRPINQLISMVRSNKLTQSSRLDRPLMDHGDEIDELCAEMAERARVVELTHRDDKLRVLGMLASGVAHDFNNLLAVISGSANLIKTKTQDPEFIAEMAQAIMQASLTGFALTRRMSILSSQQKRMTSTKPLSKIFDNVCTFTNILLKGEVPIQFEAHDDVDIHTDVGGLEAAILNLITNARDAIKGKDLGMITVSGRVTSRDEGDTLEIVVSDNGTGIPNAQLQRVTEPFFTTKRPDKGSGLGLSMVSEFVAGNNGKLHIESTQGVGTTVTIALPVDHTVSSHAEAPAPTSAAAPKDTPLRNKKHRIFILDDEPGLAKTLAMTLQNLGFICDFSDNPVDVLNDAEKLCEYDLFLCDVLLGPITGPELYNQMHSILAETCPLVVYMSGALPESATNSLPGTAPHKVLLKPFCAELLEKTINEVLAQAERGAPNEVRNDTNRSPDHVPVPS